MIFQEEIGEICSKKGGKLQSRVLHNRLDSIIRRQRIFNAQVVH